MTPVAAGAHGPTSLRFFAKLAARLCALGWDMEEKRKYPRTEIDEPGFVSSGGSVMQCMVRNISPEGAAIDVENPAFVPQQFRLVMAKDRSAVHECRVAWIQKNRIGLTFVKITEKAESPSPL